MAKTTSLWNLSREAGRGRLFDTGDDLIQVMRLAGSWRDMGRQYGAFAGEAMQQMWETTAHPVFTSGMTTEKESLELFGRRVFETYSTRMKEFTRGIADETGLSGVSGVSDGSNRR